jgi:nucleoside-diphosphate-sugar epimerase
MTKSERPVLVTGGAGFIGSHLVRRLIRDGHPVVVLTRETTDMHRIADVAPRLTVLRNDMSDERRLAGLLQELSPIGVFHCASSNIKQGVAAPEDELIRANVAGTIHLVNALRDVQYRFFVNCGSYLEYGTHDTPLKESDRCEPLEIYALTKLAGTLYCQAAARAAKKPIITFRIFSPYGPAMERGRLVDNVIRHALRNEDISLTSPDVSRDFIFVEDMADLYMEAMEKAEAHGGEVFNLASGKAVTLKEFAELVLRVTGSSSKLIWGGAKAVSYDKGCQEANMQKTYNAFAWRPTRDLKAGITKIIEAVETEARNT